MRNLIRILSTSMLFVATSATQADIYDILRGTQSSGNLSYNDVQGANLAEQAQAAQQFAQQQQLQQQIPATQVPDTGVRPTTLREEAFKELVNKTFPLLPSQIQELHKHYDDEQLAIRTPAYSPPQPVSSTLTVDLSPGATPPIIRLATGFVTSVVFVDSTGKPWPVSDYSLGNPNSFNIKWDNKTNSLFIQSVKDHASGNMAVRLGDLETPIMISIVTGQKEVDYRVDFQVPGTGPNAEAVSMENVLPSGVSNTLLGALDGVPPSGSIELKVAKDYGRAWLYNGKLLFRTKLTVLSPAWTATVSGPDGTRVYEMGQTPLILASQNGRTVKIELSGL